MSKVRVYEVAKELNLDPKAVVGLFQAVGISEVRNHMSSVEPEAVERVKRHLEKQRTHDVVEERVRTDGRVIKRRAVAKPATDVAAPSSTALPSAPRSVRDVAAAMPSSPEMVAAAPPAPLSTPDVRDRESGRLQPMVEERRSSRELPAERKSARDVMITPAEVPSPPPPAPTPPPTDVQAAPAVPAPEITAPPPSAVIPPPASVPNVAVPAPEPMVAAPVEPAAPRVEEAREPTPAPAPVAPAASPSIEPARQKTGVEYWTGRPGVPMPTPASAQRTAIGGGAAGAMARRVQYDPRAAQGAGARRPGAPQGPGGRPMMGMRGGAGMRGRPGAGFQPMRRGGPASTQEMSAHKKVIRIEENITLSSMAAKMSLKATELLGKLLSMGMTGVHINTTLDADTAKILASEFGWEVEDVAVSEEDNIAAARGEEGEAPVIDTDHVQRPPVVTVMGHVDHGKTSLLDRIRKTNVASGEAGGITQHIGAYKVPTSRGVVVFLDTPGHEAFTAMRARGAGVTDIVILVVAADDGVMPQTREAINHARAAHVPIIVAVNKIDKPSAEPDRVRRELVEAGLQPEEWGGDTIFVNVSAQSGEGVDQLLEMVGLQAEILDLKANPKRAASGTVIEALLDRGRGPVARVLVQDGTLKVGDFVLAGSGFGKVRAMTNEHGKQVHEAGPSTPVEILGLSEVPGAGDPLHAVKDSKKAMEIADGRKGKMAKTLIPATAKVSLEELSKRIAESGLLELRVIIKGDVQGSVEAVADAFAKLSGDKVKMSIIHAGVGAITEGDVNLATASKAIIIGFNVRPAGKSHSLAEENKIEIRLYSIIYDAVNDVRSAMEGLLPPTLVEKASGKAEVRQIFKVKNVVVAGCYVIEGVFKRSGKARVIRDGNTIIWDGKVAALKRFKDDAKDVAEGFECGISLDGFNELKDKDIIESYDVEEIRQKL